MEINFLILVSNITVSNHSSNKVHIISNNATEKPSFEMKQKISIGLESMTDELYDSSIVHESDSFNAKFPNTYNQNVSQNQKILSSEEDSTTDSSNHDNTESNHLQPPPKTTESSTSKSRLRFSEANDEVEEITSTSKSVTSSTSVTIQSSKMKNKDSNEDTKSETIQIPPGILNNFMLNCFFKYIRKISIISIYGKSKISS